MYTKVKHCVLFTLAVLILLPTGADSQTYPAGMISYLKFDEGTGNTAYDSINGHHGNISGAAWTSGQVGSALRFDGGSDVVKMPPSDDWDTGNQISVEAWFNLDHHTYWAQIVGRDGYWCGHGFRGWMLELYYTTDQLTFIVLDEDGNHSYSPKWPVTYGVWHHAVGVYDGSFVRLYVDGQEIGSGTPHSAPIPHRDDFYGVTVGNDHLCFHFPVHGKIDEVAIYNRALTPGEIQQHYQDGLNGLGYLAVLSCNGFEPPMAGGPVTARGNRSLPLKAQLFDAVGVEMTGLDLAALPVFQVMFSPSSGEAAVDVTENAYPAGWGTDGNQFEYNVDDGVWQYNLKTKNYTAPGTYTITMVSGDDSEYVFNPTCTATFLRTK